MNLSTFDFRLPPGRIAHSPARPRDSAKLLHVADTITDHHIPDLARLLKPGDLLVANDTRVIPAQLTARRGDATIGLTLDQPRPDNTWHALARNARRLHPGDVLTFDADPALHAEIIEKHDDGGVLLRFDGPFDRAGALALPPYIDRPNGPTADDAADYQTVFARNRPAPSPHPPPACTSPRRCSKPSKPPASRASPSPSTVGAGTFLPVRDDDVTHHRMHAERGTITPAAAAAINAATRVVAVGTTSLRLIESAVDEHGRVHPFDGDTTLFITPGYRFRRVGRPDHQLPPPEIHPSSCSPAPSRAPTA